MREVPRHGCVPGAVLSGVLLWGACASCTAARRCDDPVSSRTAAADEATPESDAYAQERRALVGELRAAGIESGAVLRAIGQVCRHCMVPDEVLPDAYDDRPLPIGHDQTISQPYVVALMSELAEIEAGDRVLEVGTGSGYQAAVLAELGAEVYSIEIVEPLARRAETTLARLGYADRVHVRAGDGYDGWPEQAPFDAIVITAAPPAVPEPLIAQLAQGGKLVAPVGRGFQQLVTVTMTDRGPVRDDSIAVRFVPMTGKAQAPRD